MPHNLLPVTIFCGECSVSRLKIKVGISRKQVFQEVLEHTDSLIVVNVLDVHSIRDHVVEDSIVERRRSALLEVYRLLLSVQLTHIAMWVNTLLVNVAKTLT